MARRLYWSPLLVCFLLLLQQDRVTSQSVTARTADGTYLTCLVDTTTFVPNDCVSSVTESDLFGGADPGTFTDADMQSCISEGAAEPYLLFARDGVSYLYGGESLAPVLMTNHQPFSSFALCCASVIYPVTHIIFAENLKLSEGDLSVAATLYTDPEERTIQHVDVCCYKDRYRILFSIDDHGLYSMGMDGTNVVQVVDYGGARTIIDMDYNCQPDNGYVALGSGAEVRLLDLDGADSASLPMLYTDITVWATNDFPMADDVVQVSLATGPGPVPITWTIWGPASSQKAWATHAAGMSNVADGQGGFPPVDYRAIQLTLNLPDLSLACPDGETCPCFESGDYHECCIGLCLPRTEIWGRDYSCYCNNPDTKASDGCLSEGTYGSIPTTCRLDLIGAIKCQGGTREWSSSIYALSLYSKTGICPTAYSGKETPMPRGATPFKTHGFHSSGYVFRAPTQFRDYGGDRYGLYSVTTGTAVNGLDGVLIDSLPVVFQESSKDLYAEYFTKTPVLGENDYLRVNVRRPCDVRRVRWRFNGLTLHKYKGKLTIPFKPFTSKQEGVYEAYFQGRIKKDWRVILWVSAATAGCSEACSSNGGFCSYDGGCICPPGMSGVDCGNNCPKGRFGVLSGCDFSCREVFGDDCANCQDVLLCLEAPAGCHCYPGYELPNCTPCPRGFWGLNCANECAAEGICDPYFGNVGED